MATLARETTPTTTTGSIDLGLALTGATTFIVKPRESNHSARDVGLRRANMILTVLVCGPQSIVHTTHH